MTNVELEELEKWEDWKFRARYRGTLGTHGRLETNRTPDTSDTF